MTRLFTGKDLRHIEIGTNLISLNAYDVGEVDDLIDTQPTASTLSTRKTSGSPRNAPNWKTRSAA